jgi:hypothetical protein
LEIDQDTKQRLKELVEGSDKSLEWAVELYEEKAEEVSEKAPGSLSDERKDSYAMSAVNGEISQDERTFTSGEEEELEILALGHRGVQEEWGQDDVDMLKSYGITRYDNSIKTAVFMNDCTEHLDAHEVKDAFDTLESLKSVYEVQESDDLQDVLVCWSSDKTEMVTDGEFDGVPSDREDKLKIIRSVVDDADLANLMDNMSATNPENGYPYDFGADLRRIDASVVDRYLSDDKSTATYTLIDDSVVTEELKDSVYMDDDSQGAAGMTVWADASHMGYGIDSYCEFIGVVDEGSNGNITMNLVGVIPIIPEPVEQEESADADANVTEEEL